MFTLQSVVESIGQSFYGLLDLISIAFISSFSIQSTGKGGHYDRAKHLVFIEKRMFNFVPCDCIQW